MFLVLSNGAPAVAGGYKERAIALVTHIPGDATFRPDLEAELDRLANAYRASQGAAVLTPSDDFKVAARAQAADMMENNFIGHRASSGEGFEQRLRAMGGMIERFGAVGENAARDSKKTAADKAKAAALFQQWVDSRPHRVNLKNRDFAFVSTGVVQRGNVIWAIQIFHGAVRKGGLFFQGTPDPQ